MDERDFPSAFIELTKDGKSLGTYLVSLWFTLAVPTPQIVEVDGKSYDIQIRPRRYYKPFSLKLHKFTHERYTGTNIPKDFASQVQLVDRTNNEDREVRIFMNNPLRYGGLTFYQASFANDDKTTILQVVRNPELGAAVHRLHTGLAGAARAVHLASDEVQQTPLRRMKTETIESKPKRSKSSGTPAPVHAPERMRWLPWAVLGLATVMLLGALREKKPASELNVRDFAKTPILTTGRIQPFDSAARNSLLIFSGKQTHRDQTEKRTFTCDRVAHGGDDEAAHRRHSEGLPRGRQRREEPLRCDG
jgi:hypothetical protein